MSPVSTDPKDEFVLDHTDGPTVRFIRTDTNYQLWRVRITCRSGYSRPPRILSQLYTDTENMYEGILYFIIHQDQR